MANELARGDRVGIDGRYRALPEPVSDLLFDVSMALAAELWTVRDRLRLVEDVLVRHGIPVAALIEQTTSDEAHLEAMREDRDAFIERVFGVLAPEVRRS